MPSPTEITVPQLSRLIGTAAAPTLLDVRIEEDYKLDPDFIPTSVRCPHQDAGMLLYDAFYRWSRDAVDESHDWP
jgi:hypothetical protein